MLARSCVGLEETPKRYYKGGIISLLLVDNERGSTFSHGSCVDVMMLYVDTPFDFFC